MARVTDASGRPVSGLAPASVNAVVSDHDDPERMGRVKVRYPTLPGEPESHWLRVLAPGAGDRRGLVARPEVGDEVLVLFLHGSHDHGVVVGGLFNGAGLPPAELDDGMPAPSDTAVGGAQRSTDTFTAGSGSDADNDRRVWRSRTGHLVVLDDSPGAGSVQLWDGTHTMALVFDVAGERVLLTNRGKDLHVRTAQDLFLEAGRDVVIRAGGRLDAASTQDARVVAGQALALEARSTASLKATGALSLEGATIDVTARGTLTLEGAQAKLKGQVDASVEGGASVRVQAGVVMIN